MIEQIDKNRRAKPPLRTNKDGNPRKPKISEVREDFLLYSPLANKLLYHEGQKIFYQYSDRYYRPLQEVEMMTIIDSFLVFAYGTLFDVTSTNVKEVYKSLERLASFPGNNFRRVSSEFIPTYSSFDDGVFDFSNPESPLLPHSLEIPSFHRFPFPFPDPSPTPHFDNYLASTFTKEDGSTDPDFADFMLTVLAYYVSPINPPNPIAVILSGSGSNGKSVYLDLLRVIVGSQFTASATMESLSDRFGPSALVGKTLNIVSEDQSKYIDTGKIKALISQEFIQLERKFQDPGTFKPTAKHIFSTNKDVKFQDIDYATTRRLAVVPFFKTFVPEGSIYEDGKMVVARDEEILRLTTHGYTGKLIRELPGIVHTLIQRLKSSPSLDFPEVVLLMKQEIESASTTSLDFFHIFYEFDPHYEELVSMEDVYLKYSTWYNENFNTEKYLMNSRSFWSMITKNYPTTKTSNKIHSKSLGKTTAARKNIRDKELVLDDDGIPFIN